MRGCQEGDVRNLVGCLVRREPWIGVVQIDCWVEEAVARGAYGEVGAEVGAVLGEALEGMCGWCWLRRVERER